MEIIFVSLFVKNSRHGRRTDASGRNVANAGRREEEKAATLEQLRPHSVSDLRISCFRKL